MSRLVEKSRTIADLLAGRPTSLPVVTIEAATDQPANARRLMRNAEGHNQNALRTRALPPEQLAGALARNRATTLNSNITAMTAMPVRCHRRSLVPGCLSIAAPAVQMTGMAPRRQQVAADPGGTARGAKFFQVNIRARDAQPERNSA